jgi:hypothetical protein
MGESNDVLLEDELGLVDGAVDYSGQPAIRSKSGYWRSAWFIIGIALTHTNLFIYFQFKYNFWIPHNARAISLYSCM